MTKRAGGKGANQAYAIAKAGGQVTLDGNVGTDGKWVREMLSDNGVDVSRVGVLDSEVRPHIDLGMWEGDGVD